MDRLEEAHVLGVVVPCAGQDALGHVVPSAEDEFHAVLRRNTVERRRNGDVRRSLDLRHGRPQEGQLEVPELLPVEHDALVVDSQRTGDVLDGLGRGVGVPAVVHVHRQRAQAEALGHVCDIAAVDSAADAHDAVVFLPAPRGLDPFDDGRELRLAPRRVVGEVGEPVEVVRAVVAAALGVEGDVGIGVGHDAARADARAAVVPLDDRAVFGRGHAFRAGPLRTSARRDQGS